MQRSKNVLCLSTDKAVYPINAMGISKAMMEKVMVAAASRNLEGTRLDVEGMKMLLLKLDFMQRIARGEHALAED